MEVEVCIESFSEAKLAAKYKAKRVELCSALDLGGLTPSSGMIEACSAISELEVHVLVRPKPGNFNYTDDGFRIMKRDILMAKKHAAKGVVFGILNSDFEISMHQNRELVELAKSLEMEATFHRAFELVQDPIQSLDHLIELGFDRLLTSGQHPTAMEGISLIEDLVKKAKNRVQIMAGSRVNSSNVQELAKTGINAVHFSSRKKHVESPPGIGTTYIPDLEKIAAIMKELNP